MIELNCHFCKMKFKTYTSSLKDDSKYYFCSRSCRATFYNKNGTTRQAINKNPFKTIPCIDCSTLMEVSKNSRNDIRCKNCNNKRVKFLKKNHQSTKICSGCKTTFISLGNKKCCSDDCIKTVLTNNGLKSTQTQFANKRSKNEILFGELLSSILKEEILFNELYFKDAKGSYWDADIILPSRKIAIHWNGPWHYKTISRSKSCSLKQIQNRDVLKYKIIEGYGFINYIIKDEGKYSKQKVNEELEKFLTTLK